MAAVTPPLRAIAEPPTPRHGPKHDNHEPYLRRRSSRIRSMRTPSPGAAQSQIRHTTRQPPKYSSSNLSPPSSPLSPNESSPRRSNKRKAPISQMDATDQLLPKPMERMLPTPIKTPSKNEKKRTTRPASRVLFAQGLRNANDVVPHRNRASLYSPGSAPEVEIYTDMNAREPELDETEDNVFYDPPHKRSSRARTRVQELAKSDEKRDNLQQDRDNEKGMWFSFRGKRVWRAYEQDDSTEYPPDTNMNGIPYNRKVTPPQAFVKTGYKPRTLFPDAYKKGHTTEDEEAITDIEPTSEHELSTNAVSQKPAATPAKQRFYATPPTTARTTRSTAKRAEEDDVDDADELSTSLFAVKKGKKSSPFSEWSRVKGDGGSASNSQEHHQKKTKRKAEPLSPGMGGKRAKNYTLG